VVGRLLKVHAAARFGWDQVLPRSHHQGFFSRSGSYMEQQYLSLSTVAVRPRYPDLTYKQHGRWRAYWRVALFETQLNSHRPGDEGSRND